MQDGPGTGRVGDSSTTGDTDRKTQLKNILKKRVPPPLSSMAVSPLDLNKGKTTKPERPGFPRKANGKLLLPAAEFKTLSNLRRAYEALDASSVTDPSVKKLIAESSAVISDLLQTHDDPDADDLSSLTTTTAPESGVDLALDRAVDEVLKMGAKFWSNVCSVVPSFFETGNGFFKNYSKI